MSNPLAEKKKAFCREYVIDLNATQAAKRAGYSEKTAYAKGHDLLKEPEVKAEIDRLMAARNQRLDINADYVLQQAVKLHEKCMSDGSFNPASAARALELIGKHTQVQAFKENLNINGTMQVMGSIKIGNKELDFDVGEPVEDEE